MRKPVVTTALVLAAIAVLAAILFVAYGRANTWELLAGDPDLGQFDMADPARSSRPNDALLCTPGLCRGVRVDGELAPFDLPPEALIGHIHEYMRTSGEIMERADDGSDPSKARYVTWTPAFRFPDTNSFEALRLEDGRTGLVAYARAQLGYSDRGNNLRRIEEITKAIR